MHSFYAEICVKLGRNPLPAHDLITLDDDRLKNLLGRRSLFQEAGETLFWLYHNSTCPGY